MKTNSGYKKRFSVTGSGKISHNRAGKGHMNRKKSASRLRRLNIGGIVEGGIETKVRRMLGM
jgi:large subunit ribosomal protein L35